MNFIALTNKDGDFKLNISIVDAGKNLKQTFAELALLKQVTKLFVNIDQLVLKFLNNCSRLYPFFLFLTVTIYINYN